MRVPDQLREKLIIDKVSFEDSQEQMPAALQVATLVPSQRYSLRHYNRERATHRENVHYLHLPGPGAFYAELGAGQV